jgi:signal transduction histidine kinase
LNATTERRASSFKPVVATARYFTSLTAIVCLGLTLLLDAFPRLAPVYHNDSLHVALAMAAALVLVLVAVVLLGRYRRSASARDLLALLAVSVLAVKNLLLSALSAILTESATAFTTWVFHGSRLLGAALLAAAAIAPGRPLRRRRPTELLAAVSTAALLGAIVGVTAVFAGELPGQFDTLPTDREGLQRFGQQPALTVLESFAALFYGVAAVAFAYHADRARDPFQMWLAIGSVIASIAFVNYALYPTLYTELLYTGDIFLFVSVLAFLFGTIREIGAYQATVTQAAVLDERRRVARDLHDGVAQELAFISSQLRWIVRQQPEERAVDQIMDSVERALDESRAAISALSRPTDESLHRALAHAATDIGSRVGARLDLDIDERVDVAGPWREALVRITREAVANAVRHGRARTVTVQLRDADGVWLRVTDDGVGFDPNGLRQEGGYGLTSMRERAEALGGQFSVSSEPGQGTSVEIMLP